MEIIDATDRLIYVIDKGARYQVFIKERLGKRTLKCSCKTFKSNKSCSHCKVVYDRSPDSFEPPKVVNIPEWFGGKEANKSVYEFLKNVGY